MIKHIVLMRFKPTISKAEIQAMMDELNALKSIIPIMHFTHGENCSPEQLNQGFNYGFTMDFQDESKRDSYLNHKEHIRIAKEVIFPALDGMDGAIVVDFSF